MKKINHNVYITMSPEYVFDALTNQIVWNKWFTTKCTIGNKIGDDVKFKWEQYGIDHIDIMDHGKIMELDKPNKFAFTWHPGETETLVEFELHRKDPGTILSLEETGYTESASDFEAFKNCSVGWGEALTLFKFYLEYGVTYGPVP